MATRTAHVKVTNIDWDANNAGIVIMTLKDVEDDADMNKIIADKLSHEYGVRPNNFEWEEMFKQ